MAYEDPENTIVMETTKGPVVIKLRPDLAPNHVARIKELASEGFYDGIVFHRVIDGFMAQVGCPHGIGTGGSSKPDLKAGATSLTWDFALTAASCWPWRRLPTGASRPHT